MSYKGKYNPKNPSKYLGDTSKIVYRSSWERLVMVWLDANDSVVRWNSERVIIPYVCMSDGKPHRYFVDFWVEVKKKDGSTKQILIEVKPEAQTKPPVLGKRKTRRYIADCATYAKNVSKWNAAKQFAQSKGMDFIVITEKSLGLKR